MFFQKIKTAFAEFEWRKLAPWLMGLGIISLVVFGVIFFTNRNAMTAVKYIPLGIGVLLILCTFLLDPKGTMYQDMQNGISDFEWAALSPWLYALGLIGLVFSGIAAYVTQFATFNEWIYIPLGIGLILILLAAFLDPEKLQSLVSGRQAKNSLNVIIMTIALVGILVAINIIVNYEGSARNWSLDLTENKSLTLSPETIQTLHSLKDPIEGRAYFTTQNESTNGLLAATKLLDNYAAQSNGKFTYKLIDPTNNPVLAIQDGITQDGTVVLTIGTRTEKVSSVTESDMTSALLRLTFPGERKVYFLTGHQEGAIDKSGDTDYSQAVQLLKNKNYTVASLDLSQVSKVPDDAKAVVIAGPHFPLMDNELQMLKAYWSKGGGIILLQSPSVITKMDATKDIFAGWLSENFGVALQNDLIYDLRVTTPTIAAASYLDTTSPITQSIQVYLIFPSSQSMTIAQPAGTTLTYTKLVQVGANTQTWGETDLASLASGTTPTYDPKTDHAAPLVVATSVNDPATNAHLVVVGSADFAANKYLMAYGNSDLFVNSVDWSAGMATMVNLTPKEATSRMVVPPFEWAGQLSLLIGCCLLPFIFMAIGISVMVVRRRHK